MSQTRALSNRQIIRAAGIALFGFLTSGVLGLVRTATISATFGAGPASDAFVVAQRIPELIFVLVAGGALGSSFIPVFNRYLLHDDESKAWDLASAVITLSSLAAAILSLIVMLIAPWIVSIDFPGSPEIHDLTTNLIRIMMLTPFIFSISGLIMGILQTFGNFVLPSLAISMNSIGLIFGALVLAYVLPPLGAGHMGQVGNANVYGLAWGSVLSALLHLGVQLPGVWRLRKLNRSETTGETLVRLRFLLQWRIEGVREVIVLMGPRVLGLGVAQLNFLVNLYFASGMVAGSATVLTYAWQLLFFALGIIGQSIGTAIFPTLAALVAEGDMTGFKDRMARALRGVLFLALPSTVGLILLGRPVVGVIFERNQWTPENTAATAWALAFFAVGIAGHASLEVLSRAFYALSDTKTPVGVGVVSLLANIVLSAVFIHFVGDPNSLERGAFAGLALANSVTTLLEALALWWLLRRRIGDLNDRYVWNGLSRTTMASAAMAVMLVLFIGLTSDRLGNVLVGIIGVVLGCGVFFAASAALRMDELNMVTGAIKRIVKR